ncbi:MAG: hypothetical protein ACR2RF_01050 [Geminicoccaceae bacterium]
MVLRANRPSKGDEARKRIMEDVTETSEQKRRLNVDVEKSLYRRIKTKAVEEERSISDITRELWVDYLSK